MPAYESIDPTKVSKKCANGLEIIQKIDEKPLSRCPYCGQEVKKIISWCRAAIMEISDEQIIVEKSQ
ncbi:MAG: hypothetical protein B1H11_09230 [Desulfobacteraceae bacterium 4484_190.1]|nr:MAG: hypothetical protein B1H11_09230 [Desulfobacteraceae bacterium 4484_190.1]